MKFNVVKMVLENVQKVKVWDKKLKEETIESLKIKNKDKNDVNINKYLEKLEDKILGKKYYFVFKELINEGKNEKSKLYMGTDCDGESLIPEITYELTEVCEDDLDNIDNSYYIDNVVGGDFSIPHLKLKHMCRCGN